MIDHQFPLIDLHRHLDGNIRPSTTWELAQEYGLALPADSLDALLPHVQITENQPDLLSFLKKLDLGVSVLKDLDACKRVAYENVEDLKLAGIDYAELRFSPYYMAMTHKLNVADVVTAVAEGVKNGCEDFGVKANLIGILSRSFGVDACKVELDGILANRAAITALDLAGDERGYPADLFTSHFNQARDAGLHITVHAGEADGPQSVWNSITVLGAERIGHGVKSVQDPKLMAFLAEQQITVESCLTSNLQTGTVEHLHQHPIKEFLAAGVNVCLNTDDPAVENIELKHEYDVAHQVVGLSVDELKQIQRNALKGAFLSDQDKQQLIDKKLKQG